MTSASPARFTNTFRQPAPFAIACFLMGVLGIWIRQAASGITESFYNQPILFIKHNPGLLTLLVAAALSFLMRIDWKVIHEDRIASRFAILLSACVCWGLLFQDYNFYFGNWFLYDRLYLLVLFVFVLRFPLFILPLLLQVNLLAGQFNFPLGKLPALDMALPMLLLKALVGLTLVQAGVRAVNSRVKKQILEPSPHFQVIFLLCVTASAYFFSGWAKGMLSPHGFEWAQSNQLTNNITAMHNRGWLKTFPLLHTFVYRLFETIETPAQWLILLGELSLLFALFSRRFATSTLWLMVLLHLGVFAMNGALFWVWMVAVLGLIRWISKEKPLLDYRSGLTGFAAIVLIGLTNPVPHLGWYDAPLDNRFVLVVNDTVEVSLSEVSPYTRKFQQGDFLAVLDTAPVYPGFLVYDFHTMLQLTNAKDSSISTWVNTHREAQHGMLKPALQRLLQRYLIAPPKNPLRFLQPPAYWNAHTTDALSDIDPETVRSITLFHVYEWNHQDQTRVIKKVEVLRVTR